MTLLKPGKHTLYVHMQRETDNTASTRYRSIVNVQPSKRYVFKIR